MGSSASQFDLPLGVAISADTLTLWVAENGNNRISIWTRPNGASTSWSNSTTFGSAGSGPSNFSSPQGIAVSADELTIWVVEHANHRVSVWTRPDVGSTTWTNNTTFGGFGSASDKFKYPRGIYASADKLTVWVADTDNARISIWNRPDAGSTSWTNVSTFGSYGSGPENFDGPWDIALSADMLAAWITEPGNGRVSIWVRPNGASTSWSNSTTFGTQGTAASEFNNPRGIAVSSDTLTVWVVDCYNNRISIWRRLSTGATTWTNDTTFGSLGNGANQFYYPGYLALSPNETTMWVADTAHNAISIWNYA